MYVYYGNKTSDNYLAHYGVLGMKWGIRKEREKAAEAKKKLNKLSDKAVIRAETGKLTKKKYEKTMKKAVKLSREYQDSLTKLRSDSLKLARKTREKNLKQLQKEKNNDVTTEDRRMKYRKERGITQQNAKKSTSKSISEMSDAELKSKIARLQLEKQFKDLSPAKVKTGKDIATRALEQAGEKVLTNAILFGASKAATKLLGGNSSQITAEAFFKPKK